MTADQLYTALTKSGKPMLLARRDGSTNDRLAKAKRMADSPETWAEVERRLAAYLAYTPPDPPPAEEPTV